MMMWPRIACGQWWNEMIGGPGPGPREAGEEFAHLDHLIAEGPCSRFVGTPVLPELRETAHRCTGRPHHTNW